MQKIFKKIKQKIFFIFFSYLLIISPSFLSSEPFEINQITKREAFSIKDLSSEQSDMEIEETTENNFSISSEKEDFDILKFKLGPLVKTKPEDLEKEKKNGVKNVNEENKSEEDTKYNGYGIVRSPRS